MISLHQLRTFLDVARTGSVRDVAKESVVSQPAVSAALAGLQRELGVPLVERDGRGLRLTDAGREVEGTGRRILALLEELRIRAQAAASPEAGHLRLGVVTTAAEHLVPGLLAGFRDRYPHAAIDLDVANRARIWDRLAYGEIELALGGRPPLDRAFRSIATSPNELVIVAKPGTVAGAAALTRATWLLREPGSGTRLATEEVIDSLDAAPHHRFERRDPRMRTSGARRLAPAARSGSTRSCRRHARRRSDTFHADRAAVASRLQHRRRTQPARRAIYHTRARGIVHIDCDLNARCVKYLQQKDLLTGQFTDAHPRVR